MTSRRCRENSATTTSPMSASWRPRPSWQSSTASTASASIIIGSAAGGSSKSRSSSSSLPTSTCRSACAGPTKTGRAPGTATQRACCSNSNTGRRMQRPSSNRYCRCCATAATSPSTESRFCWSIAQNIFQTPKPGSRHGARRPRLPGFPACTSPSSTCTTSRRPNEVGADALVEFPPHKFGGPQSAPTDLPTITNADFTGGFVDYKKIIAQSALKAPPSYPYYRGIIPSWDNTARRQDTGTTVLDARPDLFGAWLRYLRTYARQSKGGIIESHLPQRLE